MRTIKKCFFVFVTVFLLIMPCLLITSRMFSKLCLPLSRYSCMKVYLSVKGIHGEVIGTLELPGVGLTHYQVVLNTFEEFNLIDIVQPASSEVSLSVNRGERIVFSGPNTNTNIIRVHKYDRIRIRILFVFFIMTEYEYEYYSGSEI